MRVLLLLALGCGSQAATAPANSPNDPSTDEPVQPAEPMTEPSAPTDPATADQGPVVHYAIDGAPVDEATFNALFERLDVDDQAYTGETVENPDGSYGGAGQYFHAREGEVSYRYEFHTHPRDDGRVGESRMLFRE